MSFVFVCGKYHGTFTTTLFAAIAIAFSPSTALGQAGIDYALSFNGTNDLMIVPNNPLLELTDGTLELWFKPDWAPGSTTYDSVLIANRQGPSLTRYSLNIDRNLASVMLANGTSVSTVPYAFTRGQWYHLALVDGGSTAQVYVNGQLVGSTTNGFGTLIGLPLNLGSDGSGQFFRGQMDEVRIWNVARSATDIRYNLSRALAGTEPGLVGYWRLDEGDVSIAIDATTNHLDGTLSGATWSKSAVVLVNTSGSLGMALDLTASRSNYVQVASAPSLTLTNQFTFGAWIKPRTAQCNTILARGDGANLATTDYIFQVGTDGTNCGVMKVALMAGGQWTTSASTLPTNAWVHVAVTCDGATNRFYINGLLDRAVTATGSVYQSASPLFIGRQGSSGGNYFDGVLDEVRVWNTTRSAAQIQTNLNRVLPVNEPSLMGYWRFNEQAGIGAFDVSGRANHGTLMNRSMRVVSFWVPSVTVNGANPLQQECHSVFSDPGTTVNGAASAVAAGDYHSLTLLSDGTIRGWGLNDSGQVSVIVGTTNVLAISAGFWHSLALKYDGTVIGWGANGSGQISIPAGVTNVAAISASYFFSLALKGDGSVLGWGDNSYGETSAPANATNVVAIAAGGGTSLALRSDGRVLAWGANAYGQTNIPVGLNNVVAIAAGAGHCLALKADGTVRAWGLNDSRQTNVPASVFSTVSIAAGLNHSLALRADGTVIGWGNNAYGEINVPADATNIVAIAAGGNHSLAVNADGRVFAWGRNDSGEVKVPPDVNHLNFPVFVRGAVNANVPGAYVLTYVTTNPPGGVALATRTVIVADTTPPNLTLVGANPLNLDAGASFSDPGAIATDACEGDLTANIVRTDSVNTTLPGAYTLTYTVADSGGHTSTTNRTVLVRGAPAILGFTAFFSGTNAVTGSPVVQFLADVNPNGLATVAFAQYGLNTSYPGRTASVNLPASYNTSTFFATLDGLVPGAIYHFRVAASNSLGVAYGPDQTFTVPTLFAAGDLNGDGRVDQNELDNVLSNFWLTSPSLVMTNPTTLGGGLFQFALTNVTGWNLSVFASTNLTDWELLPAPARPVWQFLDPAYTNYPQRFYRLQWP